MSSYNSGGMTISIEGGIQPDTEGYGTQMELLRIFHECLQLQQKKGQTYGKSWREQGYMGNVGRVLSKASRLRHMLWRDFPLDSAEEGVVDTLRDLINLAAFAMINHRNQNRWGNDV